MIIAGLIIIAFSILLITSSNRQREQRERVWRNCSARSISLAYQAQICFQDSNVDFVYVCYSEESGSFWIERDALEFSSSTWGLKLNRRDSFEKHCLEIERFVATAPYCNE